jgi:hypothetical protein
MVQGAWDHLRWPRPGHCHRRDCDSRIFDARLAPASALTLLGMAASGELDNGSAEAYD